jgi:hypothetical protein
MTIIAHTDVAQRVARDTGWNLDEHAAERGWSAVGLGPVGRHRDSDALALSNFRVVYGDLHEKLGNAVEIVRFNHWAVGWVEELAWDAGRADAVAAVDEWRAALESYPVADEMDWSILEDEMNHPSDGLCYADSPDDCGCDLPAA